MNLRREDKKRLPSRNPQLLAAPSCANVYGCVNFIHGTLVNGQKFSELNALEDFSREWLGIEVYKSARSTSSVGLERIVAKLREQRAENDFRTAGRLSRRNRRKIRVHPSKSTQNSYIERFNKTYMEEVLDFYLFRHLTQLKEITGNLYYWMVLTWGGLQLDL